MSRNLSWSRLVRQVCPSLGVCSSREEYEDMV